MFEPRRRHQCFLFPRTFLLVQFRGINAFFQVVKILLLPMFFAKVVEELEADHNDVEKFIISSAVHPNTHKN